MSWLTSKVLRLDRANKEAEKNAALEENVRLALWRMDFALYQLIAQENARPTFWYGTTMQGKKPNGTSLYPDSMHSDSYYSKHLTSPYIEHHFQFDSTGNLITPDSEPSAKWEKDVTKNELVASMKDYNPLKAKVKKKPPKQKKQSYQSLLKAPFQRSRSEYETFSRNQMMNAQVQSDPAAQKSLIPDAVAPGLIVPIWDKGSLYLLRRVFINQEEFLQGCMLDWPGLKEMLINLIDDLLPNADLEAVDDWPQENDTRLLAAIPVRLEPGILPYQPGTSFSLLYVSLFIAWICVLAAVLAAGGILSATISLSNRRADFVSAVTHELRSPLTSLQMYAEMLDQGMVKDEQKQKRYITTLHREAKRLSHLVENVLTFARLEKKKEEVIRESIPLADLIERVEPRLIERIEKCEMTLETKMDEKTSSARVLAETSAVERILFNLVDNGCKYAAEAKDKRILLHIAQGVGRVQFSVQDFGPGLSKRALKKLFQPFSKSSEDAATSAPGVGLGLAICRRLARQMGGDLVLDKSQTKGSRFLLTLPLDHGRTD